MSGTADHRCGVVGDRRAGDHRGVRSAGIDRETAAACGRLDVAGAIGLAGRHGYGSLAEADHVGRGEHHGHGCAAEAADELDDCAGLAGQVDTDGAAKFTRQGHDTAASCGFNQRGAIADTIAKSDRHRTRSKRVDQDGRRRRIRDIACRCGLHHRDRL